MYFIHKSQQLDDPKETDKAFSPYLSSAPITNIDTSLLPLSRPTDQTRAYILLIAKKPEKAIAVITPSHRPSSDDDPLAIFLFGKPNITLSR